MNNFNTEANQTTHMQAESENSLPPCLGMIFTEDLKNSDLTASLNGYANPVTLDGAMNWGNCAAFTVNGNPAFMMRGCRGFISMVIEDGEAILLTDIQFWSENAIFNSTSDLPSPYECLTAFYLNIDMMNHHIPQEGAVIAMDKLFTLRQVTRLDGFLPKHELVDITPKIEQMVLNKFTEYNLMFMEYDFSIDYAGNFITGSINKHTFEITRTFNGLAMDFAVFITSNLHLNLSTDSGNHIKLMLR